MPSWRNAAPNGRTPNQHQPRESGAFPVTLCVASKRHTQSTGIISPNRDGLHPSYRPVLPLFEVALDQLFHPANDAGAEQQHAQDEDHAENYMHPLAQRAAG